MYLPEHGQVHHAPDKMLEHTEQEHGVKTQSSNISQPMVSKDTDSKEALVQSLEKNLQNQRERFQVNQPSASVHPKLPKNIEKAAQQKGRSQKHNKSVGTDCPPGDPPSMATISTGAQPRLDHKGFISELEQLLLTNSKLTGEGFHQHSGTGYIADGASPSAIAGSTPSPWMPTPQGNALRP